MAEDCDTVGATDGILLGAFVGVPVGVGVVFVGELVGILEGEGVGASLGGALESAAVGDDVGVPVGPGVPIILRKYDPKISLSAEQTMSNESALPGSSKGPWTATSSAFCGGQVS